MKVTKYNQSTLLVETNNIRILIDPSIFGFREEYVDKYWVDIDAILVTHKHSDHCNIYAIEKIIERDNSLIYTSHEVANDNNFKNLTIVKENDVFNIGDIKIEVTKAIHGYLTGMRENGKEIIENIGFIIDDKNTRLYTTSDTINFYNNYKCDILCMPFNGNGLTMGIIDGLGFAKGINPKLLLPVHMEHPNPIMNPNLKTLSSKIEEIGLNYKILDIGESIEL